MTSLTKIIYYGGIIMAVDPKYVEEVKDEQDFEEVMEALGLEGHYEQIGNGLDLEGYEITTMRDMYPDDGTEWIGKPVISDIYTTEFTNKTTGETVVNHKIDLVLLDDTYEDEKEAYVFPINLKSDNIDFDKNIVKNVHSASGLYALAMGIAELKVKGISKSFNHLDVVAYKKLQQDVSKYSNMTVKVVEKKMVDKKTKEETYYNAFKIVDAE